MNEETNENIEKIEKSIKRNYLLLFWLDPTQYDGRIKHILHYFHKNNEPLFYLAFSYCSMIKIFINNSYCVFCILCCF